MFPYMDSPILTQRLSLHLSRSPHLASYIRTLVLELCTTEEVDLIPELMSAVPALTSLALWTRFKDYFPPSLSNVGAFSLKTLRRIELGNYLFKNASDLESLLSNAKCLKELPLTAMQFDKENISAVPARTVQASDTVQLESVCLDSMYHRAITAMLDSFTVVDIRHLKSLSMNNAPTTALLQANTRSIQKLKIGSSSPVAIYYLNSAALCLEPPIPGGENRLTDIELEAIDVDSIPVLVPMLGDLRNLTALKTLGVTLRARGRREGAFAHGQWERVDALLEPLLAGVQVNLFAKSDAHAKQMKEDHDAIADDSVP
ncbi:hypothetical protein C8R45DRAFT_1104255 [Mycena sanguinolenta]|nr:hypothetical protein C8R45DRAFT_1104255 [Mycena sanguinolenta]